MEPFGDQRGDWQAAAICASICNVLLATRGVKKRFRIKDFVLEFGDAKEVRSKRQTWQEQKMIAQMIVAAFNEPEKKKRNG